MCKSNLKFLKIVLPVFIALLASCESVVEVPIPEHTSKLAVRCTIANETLDTIYYQLFPESMPFVGESRSILDGKRPPEVTTATMVITDASGTVLETFEHNTAWNYVPGYYKPVTNFKPEPGQRYKLTVSAPGFETATGELTLPQPVNSPQATFAVDYKDDYQISGRLRFTIPDNGAEENYYFLQVIPLDSLHNPIRNAYIDEEEDETGIGNDIQGIYLSRQYSEIQPFNDKTFNGSTLTTKHDITVSNYYGGPVGTPQGVKIRYLKAVISSITKDTFVFHKSVDVYYDTNENPFAEPTRIQGNLKNGYGYFGGHTNSYIEIEIPQ